MNINEYTEKDLENDKMSTIMFLLYFKNIKISTLSIIFNVSQLKIIDEIKRRKRLNN